MGERIFAFAMVGSIVVAYCGFGEAATACFVSISHAYFKVESVYSGGGVTSCKIVSDFEEYEALVMSEA